MSDTTVPERRRVPRLRFRRRPTIARQLPCVAVGLKAIALKSRGFRGFLVLDNGFPLEIVGTTHQRLERKAIFKAI